MTFGTGQQQLGEVKASNVRLERSKDQSEGSNSLLERSNSLLDIFNVELQRSNASLKASKVKLERSNGPSEAKKKGVAEATPRRKATLYQMVGVGEAGAGDSSSTGSSGFAVLLPRNGCRPCSVSFSPPLP